MLASPSTTCLLSVPNLSGESVRHSAVNYKASIGSADPRWGLPGQENPIERIFTESEKTKRYLKSPMMNRIIDKAYDTNTGHKRDMITVSQSADDVWTCGQSPSTCPCNLLSTPTAVDQILNDGGGRSYSEAFSSVQRSDPCLNRDEHLGPGTYRTEEAKDKTKPRVSSVRFVDAKKGESKLVSEVSWGKGVGEKGPFCFDKGWALFNGHLSVFIMPECV